MMQSTLITPTMIRNIPIPIDVTQNATSPLSWVMRYSLCSTYPLRRKIVPRLNMKNNTMYIKIIRLSFIVSAVLFLISQHSCVLLPLNDYAVQGYLCLALDISSLIFPTLRLSTGFYPLHICPFLSPVF